MKEDYHAPHRMQVHQILALGAHLQGASGVGTTRGERAPAARDVEAIVSRDLELAREKCVRGFLQSAIGAGNHHCVRSPGSPAELGTGHVTLLAAMILSIRA